MKKIIATAVMGLFIALTPLSASAQTSYFDQAWFQKMNQMKQINFAKSVVTNYTNITNRYSFIIDKYSRYSNASWYKRIQTRYTWHMAEIEKYNTIINSNNAPTVVRTYVEEVPGTIVNRGETTTTTDNKVVEEQEGNIIKEWAVITVTQTTPVTTTYYTNYKTVSVYTNGKETYSNDVKVDSKETINEINTQVERELIREYALVVPIEEEPEAPTTIVFTEAEYLARGDVDYTVSDSYYNAVKNMNSNINDSYVERLGGYFGNNLDKVGAPAAWSRGYTGEGSVIAIFDTGIDTDHSEFTDSIIDMQCFTNVCERGLGTVEDGNKYGHGTHVAGIAAANLDGVGTTGVAPDADLLIGKLAYDSGFFQFNKIPDAMEWAVNNGADVVNISAGTRPSGSYKNSLTEISEGVYYSNMTFGDYNTLGYNQIFSTNGHGTAMIESMKGHETVMVLASGNDRLKVSSQESHIALDSEIGDRVLVVGMYDERRKGLSKWSNAAGTICRELDGDGTCKSDALISDRYIIAPGVYIAAPTNNGEYTTMTGTSMAAPHVAGAVAIVHQMWPHMTGANVSQLLLNTASTDEINNYDPNVHGQGMLDLDEATQPQGAMGLATTGRIDGATVDLANSGAIAMSGNTNISALSSIMAVDEYDRDYYFDANGMVNTIDTRTASATLAGQHGFAPDYYIGYNGGSIIPVSNAGTHIALNDTNGNVSIVQQWDKFSMGLVNESESFLGNYANSELMKVDGSNTAYVGFTDSIDFNNGINMWGSATLGATRLNVDNSSMLKSADIMMSNSATLGIKQTVDNETFGFVASLPVSITSGNANFSIPTSVSSTGDISNTNMNSSLEMDNRELDLGLFYINTLTESTSFTANIELRNNYSGTSDNHVTAGLTYKVTF
jgi:subtilisin family serine protease